MTGLISHGRGGGRLAARDGRRAQVAATWAAIEGGGGDLPPLLAALAVEADQAGAAVGADAAAAVEDRRAEAVVPTGQAIAVSHHAEDGVVGEREGVLVPGAGAGASVGGRRSPGVAELVDAARAFVG